MLLWLRFIILPCANVTSGIDFVVKDYQDVFF